MPPRAMLITALLLILPWTPCAAQTPVATATAPPLTAASLRQLSNADLLTTYQSTALAAGATDAPIASINPADYDEKCLLIKAEIVHRGRPMVPFLVAALKTEVTLTRPKVADHFPPGLVTDEIQLLTIIGDPAAVTPLLDIVASPIDPKHENTWDPHARALSAVERLTFVSFHKVQPHFGNFSDALQHPLALNMENFAPENYSQAVLLYRDWLAAEGRDPAQWLPLARARAHALLKSDNLDDIYCAAAFLTQPFLRDATPRLRDDLPDQTLARLAQILAAASPLPGGKKYDYQYQGHPLPISLYNWVELLTTFGPRARPSADTLIRFQKETGLNNWGGIQEMNKVGGPDIMAFYFDTLPTINKEVTAIQNTLPAPTGFASDDPRGWWFDAQATCRAGIDRWAGRHFTTDADRIAWWNANRTRSPEQWLRDSLPITVDRADAGNPPDILLYRQLFPDAPTGTDEPTTIAPRITLPGTTPLPFRKKWFEQHRSEFHYNPDTGAFHLPNAPAR